MWLNIFEITDSCFHVLVSEQFYMFYLFYLYVLFIIFVYMFYLLFFRKHLENRVVLSQCYFGIAFISLVLIDIVRYMSICFRFMELLQYHFCTTVL